MDVKSPTKKKSKLIVYHQDGMLCNEDRTCAGGFLVFTAAGHQMDQLQSQQFLPLTTVWYE